MSSPIVIISHNITPSSSSSYSSKFTTSLVSSLPPHRTRLSLFIANANHNNENNNNNNNYGGQRRRRRRRRRRSWWHNFFFNEEGNWFGLKKDPLLDDDDDDDDDDVDGDEEERFQAWKRRAEAISELREMQEGVRNAQSRRWEDWLHVQGPSSSSSSSSSTSSSWDQDIRPATTGQMMPQRGFIDSARQLLLADDDDDDDFTYEDRVFQYASSNSAKFLAFLVILPWALDFMVHDYLLMPFLDRYVKTVPLAAEFFDVRRSQKLDMIKSLKVEEARFRFEIEIGKSPPLSDEEVWLELRHKALELRDEWRLENRKRFANIWSDMVYGIAVFILLYFNQSKVALLQFTGYKILNNVSDTGKAFLIILITDIFLGYHSESGWQTLLEILVEHYGLEVDQSAITIFVCFVPVVIDACVKLWLFKFLPRLSPKVANIFQEMKRH